MRSLLRGPALAIMLLTWALIAVVGVIGWTSLSNTDTRVQALEAKNVCAQRETKKCQEAIDGFISSLSVEERQRFAAVLAPYQTVAKPTVVKQRPIVVVIRCHRHRQQHRHREYRC